MNHLRSCIENALRKGSPNILGRLCPCAKWCAYVEVVHLCSQSPSSKDQVNNDKGDCSRAPKTLIFPDKCDQHREFPSHFGQNSIFRDYADQ